MIGNISANPPLSKFLRKVHLDNSKKLGVHTTIWKRFFFSPKVLWKVHVHSFKSWVMYKQNFKRWFGKRFFFPKVLRKFDVNNSKIWLLYKQNFKRWLGIGSFFLSSCGKSMFIVPKAGCSDTYSASAYQTCICKVASLTWVRTHSGPSVFLFLDQRSFSTLASSGWSQDNGLCVVWTSCELFALFQLN